MKKHWQIKPWIAITAIVILLGSILFAIGGSKLAEKSLYVADQSYYGADYAMSVPSAEPEMMFAKTTSRNMAYDSGTSAIEERMVIKTGYLSMIVGNVVNSAKTITDYVEQKGGFIVNTSVDKSGIELYGSVTVRVPSNLFKETIDHVKTLGDVESENISGQDITEQYTDLDSQLKNLKATEEQFLSIMKTAVKIEDVLAVQRELMNVRGQIEMIEGRMKYMKESVDMSSLTVYLSTDPSKLPIVDEGNQWKPIAILKDAFRSLLGTGQGLVNGLIWVVVYIPAIVVLGLIAWIIRRLWKRFGKKK